MVTRCPECGSWEAECASETPVQGCGCARCLRAEIERLREQIEIRSNESSDLVKQAIRNNAEIERLQVEIGEMKLVLESQDLRLKQWMTAIKAWHSAWLRLPMYQDEYEAAFETLAEIAMEGR